MPESYRFGVWVLAMANLVCCVLWEWGVVDKFVRQKVKSREERKRRAEDVRREHAVGIGRPADIDSFDMIGLLRSGMGMFGGVFSGGVKVDVGQGWEMGNLEGDEVGLLRRSVDDVGLMRPSMYQEHGSATVSVYVDTEAGAV